MGPSGQGQSEPHSARAAESRGRGDPQYRRIRLLMSRACPHQDLFRTVALQLDSS